MSIIIAAVIAIILVPAVSFFTSKMKSLPVDFICSAISISVISLDVFAQLTKSKQVGENAIYTVFLVNLGIALFSVLSIIGYLFYEKDKEEHKLIVKRGAYLYSLFLACILINFAYVYVKHAQTIFSSQFDKNGSIGNFVGTLFQFDNEFKYVLITTAIVYIVAVITQFVPFNKIISKQSI